LGTRSAIPTFSRSGWQDLESSMLLMCVSLHPSDYAESLPAHSWWYGLHSRRRRVEASSAAQWLGPAPSGGDRLPRPAGGRIRHCL